MTIQLVPTTFTDSSYVQRCTFEGTLFVVQFDFNQRCASWYMSLADSTGIDIYNGVKLTCGPLLLKRCADPRRPAGDFIVVSSTSDQSPPGELELLPGSGRCSLLYITSDSLAEIAAGNSADLIAQVQANAATTNVSTYGQQ